MVNKFYFETLPLHPQPQPFESFTGYLTRLAEANQITTIRGLSTLLFPMQSPSVVRRWADYPCLQLETLSTAAVCSEDQLHVMTFYHLSRKFARSTQPQAGSRFLAEVLTEHLQYCPACIAEKGYYSLLWRFACVKTCPEHNCMLVECCQKCGNKIPFLSTPLKIGICPQCRFCFGQGNIVSPNPDTLLESQSYIEQLKFLLSPQAFEKTADKYVESIGARFAQLRSAERKSRHEMAKLINTTVTCLTGIERGEPRQYSSNFAAYIRYCKYFDLNFSELFQEAITSGLVKRRKPKYGIDLIDRVETAIEFLKESGKLVSMRAMIELIGVARETLVARPEIKLMLEQTIKHNKEFTSQDIAVAIKELRTQGKPITQDNVAKALGFSRGIFQYKPTLARIVREAKEN